MPVIVPDPTAPAAAPAAAPHPRAFWPLLKQAGARFIADDTLQEGAALAYYTVFALPGLLVLITRAAGAFFGPQVVSGALYREVAKVVGTEGAADVQTMAQKSMTDAGLSVAAVVGIVTLVLSATGAFVSLQETLNQIWGVRARPGKAWLKFLLDRGRSFGLILAAAALLLASVVAQAVLGELGEWLQTRLPGADFVLLWSGNLLISLLLTTALFAGIFKVLPDAHVRWRDVLPGAAFTAALFTLGKALIGVYLGQSSVTSIYGAAGTVIVLLAWVFYTSQTLFFGAILTRCYAEAFGLGIRPSAHAVRVRVVEVSDENDVKVKHEPTASTDPVAVPDAAKDAVRALREDSKGGYVSDVP